MLSWRLTVTWPGPHCAAAPSAAMGRDPSSLRAGQHAVSGEAFLKLLPAACTALLMALRFVFARGLLSPLVTLLTYWAGACWLGRGPACVLRARAAEC